MPGLRNLSNISNAANPKSRHLCVDSTTLRCVVAKSLTKKNVRHRTRSTIKSGRVQGGEISHQMEVTQLSPSYSQLEELAPWWNCSYFYLALALVKALSCLQRVYSCKSKKQARDQIKIWFWKDHQGVLKKVKKRGVELEGSKYLLLGCQRCYHLTHAPVKSGLIKERWGKKSSRPANSRIPVNSCSVI